MPVCLNPDYGGSNDLLLTHAGSGIFPETRAPLLHVGLINNMPDAALRATERQFLRLLNVASGNTGVLVSFYAVPEVPRGREGISHLSRFYLDIEELWSSSLDALIVTGAEPRASRLTDEPYWEALTNVFEWAENNTRSTIVSCLSAHAAVLYFDNLERRRLSAKCSGLFECRREYEHFLTAGTPERFRIPHSRWNEIPEHDLVRNGYLLLSRSPRAGADMFVRQGKSLFVFFQGHPEYEPDTLLLEYHRELNRYLRQSAGLPPSVPAGYLESHTADLTASLRDQAPVQAFLVDTESGREGSPPVADWSSVAERIYSNWLMHLEISTYNPDHPPEQQVRLTDQVYRARAASEV